MTTEHLERRCRNRTDCRSFSSAAEKGAGRKEQGNPSASLQRRTLFKKTRFPDKVLYQSHLRFRQLSLKAAPERLTTDYTDYTDKGRIGFV
jgi:hypothetical protein